MKILVVNKYWKAVVKPDKAHLKEYPDSHAIACDVKRKIQVRRSSLNKATIIHELLHAYKFELSFYELDLDDDQVDEWHCELWAKYGDFILKDTKAMMERYAKKQR